MLTEIQMIAVITILSTSAFAQTKVKSKTQQSAATTAVYTCTMHPEVCSNKPGKCSKCGMDLTKVKAYSCAMHPEVTSDKASKCSKCGMGMTKVKTYACPMHPDQCSTTKGKCSKCGMDMTEIKSTKAKKS